jgi:ABC-2 type transport system ATP-binding protein
VGRDEMLGLIRRIHADFGISVLVTSHLLGELERTSDHVVVIDGGRLLRSSSTRDFTQATASLAVEVTDTEECRDGTRATLEALTSVGLTARADGHLLLVDIRDEATYDTVRDTVADLGIGLIRMEQRRHRIAEIFDTAPREVAPAVEGGGRDVA